VELPNTVAKMNKKSEDTKIAIKEKELDLARRSVDRFWAGVKKEIKLDFGNMINFLMFTKKRGGIADLIHVIEWLSAMVGFFFALKGFSFWLTGR